LVSVVESRLREGSAILGKIEIRQRVCRGPGCSVIFYICRSCDRGQRYHDNVCRHRARCAQRRQANRQYQASFTAKLDHAARQRAYTERQKLKKVTGQGSKTAGPSVTIDSAPTRAGVMMKDPEKDTLHGKPNPFRAHPEPGSGLVFCVVCGRAAPSPP
jgi:hypothetical protein